jgi:hypothetical protein
MEKKEPFKFLIKTYKSPIKERLFLVGANGPDGYIMQLAILPEHPTMAFKLNLSDIESLTKLVSGLISLSVHSFLFINYSMNNAFFKLIDVVRTAPPAFIEDLEYNCQFLEIYKRRCTYDEFLTRLDPMLKQVLLVARLKNVLNNEPNHNIDQMISKCKSCL